ncbi:MAG TPA: hypothetical protein PKA55_07910 [Rhodoblastus sp.]|nr:hypothetical protein [Rhodoblastus sp.]
MLRALVDKLSGFQLTAIILAALFIPGAVGAAVTYQAVGLIDPITGVKGRVLAGGRLWTQDYFADFKNNPINRVRISNSTIGDGTYRVIYTIPSGKALIIDGATVTIYNGTNGADNYMYCSVGSMYITLLDSPNSVATQSYNLGSGIYLHPGDKIQCKGSNFTNANLVGLILMQGYLVPAAAVPAIGSVEEREQSVAGAILMKK